MLLPAESNNNNSNKQQAINNVDQIHEKITRLNNNPHPKLPGSLASDLIDQLDVLERSHASGYRKDNYEDHGGSEIVPKTENWK